MALFDVIPLINDLLLVYFVSELIAGDSRVSAVRIILTSTATRQRRTAKTNCPHTATDPCETPEAAAW